MFIVIFFDVKDPTVDERNLSCCQPSFWMDAMGGCRNPPWMDKDGPTNVSAAISIGSDTTHVRESPRRRMIKSLKPHSLHRQSKRSLYFRNSRCWFHLRRTFSAYIPEQRIQGRRRNKDDRKYYLKRSCRSCATSFSLTLTFDVLGPEEA